MQCTHTIYAMHTHTIRMKDSAYTTSSFHIRAPWSIHKEAVAVEPGPRNEPLNHTTLVNSTTNSLKCWIGSKWMNSIRRIMESNWKRTAKDRLQSKVVSLTVNLYFLWFCGSLVIFERIQVHVVQLVICAGYVSENVVCKQVGLPSNKRNYLND